MLLFATAAIERPSSMLVFNDRLYTFFDPHRIYASPDGLDIRGGGQTFIAYDGDQFGWPLLVARGGIYVAFDRGGVYLSRDGKNLGGGGRTVRPYDGHQKCFQLVEGSGGLYARFVNDVYFSPDWDNLGGGGRTRNIYSGRGAQGPVKISVQKGKGTNGRDAVAIDRVNASSMKSVDGLVFH